MLTSPHWGSQMYAPPRARASSQVREWKVRGRFSEVCAISSKALRERKTWGHARGGGMGTKQHKKSCCDAFHSTRRVDLNTFQACNYCSSSNKGETMSSSGWHAETKENRPEMRKVSRESNENKEKRARCPRRQRKGDGDEIQSVSRQRRELRTAE